MLCSCQFFLFTDSNTQATAEYASDEDVADIIVRRRNVHIAYVQNVLRAPDSDDESLPPSEGEDAQDAAAVGGNEQSDNENIEIDVESTASESSLGTEGKQIYT